MALTAEDHVFLAAHQAEIESMIEEGVRLGWRAGRLQERRAMSRHAEETSPEDAIAIGATQVLTWAEMEGQVVGDTVDALRARIAVLEEQILADRRVALEVESPVLAEVRALRALVDRQRSALDLYCQGVDGSGLYYCKICGVARGQILRPEEHRETCLLADEAAQKAATATVVRC